MNGNLAAEAELIVYTYDSLMAESGLAKQIEPLFEKRCGCKLKFISVGDAAQLSTRLQIDEKRAGPTAHIVMGIDQNLWPRVKKHTVQDDFSFPELKGLPDLFKVGTGFVAFDYGVFAWMMDSDRLRKNNLTPPKKLRDLLKPDWKRELILEDPRTSTPGLAFLLFTKKILGQEFSSFWSAFHRQWLTLSPGWDEAYGLFLKQQATLVWSYTTSEAYHRVHGDADRRYRAIILDDGSPLQVEGAALIKASLKSQKMYERAKEFLQFLLSQDVQKIIPKTQWMLPVVRSTPLPGEFENLPFPKNPVRLDTSQKEIESLLKEWRRAIQ